VPSAEVATLTQLLVGAPVTVHVAPESIETQIEKHSGVATHLCPFAEQAMEDQLTFGALATDQDAPEFVEK